MSSGRGETETAAFTGALASLKRRGSNLLLVGAAGEATHGDACGRLLGDDTAERRRLFVRTEGEGATARHGVADDAAVVRYESTTRSTAAASAGSSSTDRDRRARTLPQLGEAVTDAIETLEESAGGLAPAELRVCFDSLRPLVEEYPEQEVFRFVHAVTADVRGVNGMAHYHLPVAYDTGTVRTLAPLFDAVIEVRSGPDCPQQRWHLRETGVSTDWLQL